MYLKRPKNFSEIIGQNDAKLVLKQAEKIDYHAYLFTGPRGVGKTSMAKIFAFRMICSSTEKPCYNCETCRVENILEIDGGTHRGINEITNIINTLHYLPFFGQKKILILDEVHLLSPDAFGKLLAFVEQPPFHVRLLFITTEADNIPETFKSRCIEVPFFLFTFHELVEICRERFPHLQDNIIRFLCRRARGSLRQLFLEGESSENIIFNCESDENFAQVLQKKDILGFLIENNCHLERFLEGLVDYCLMQKEYHLAGKISFHLGQYKGILSPIGLFYLVMKIID